MCVRAEELGVHRDGAIAEHVADSICLPKWHTGCGACRCRTRAIVERTHAAGVTFTRLLHVPGEHLAKLRPYGARPRYGSELSAGDDHGQHSRAYVGADDRACFADVQLGQMWDAFA